ncbi:hypothetical protein OAH81_01190 [Candidatus Pseudothioglobus singularis]|nr:hypothetical protein [Candidatus Pseudothioglobus singularis]
MLLIIFLLLWAFSLFYGISLIRTDRRRLGISFLIIFSIPILLFLIAGLFIDFSYLDCMFRESSDVGAAEMMDYCRSL